MSVQHERIRRLASGAVGEGIWGAVAGPQDDYVFLIDAGEKRRRTMRLANKALSFVQRTFEGSFRFLIECPWRLDAPDRVIASSVGLLGRRDPPLSDRFGEIADHTIDAIEIGPPPGWDLHLRISGGFALHCLCAEVDARGKRNNWSLWTPEGLVTIAPGGRVIEQSAAEAAAKMKSGAPKIDDDVDEDELI